MYRPNQLLNATVSLSALSGITSSGQYTLYMTLISNYSDPSLDSTAVTTSTPIKLLGGVCVCVWVWLYIPPSHLGINATAASIDRATKMATFSWDSRVLPSVQGSFISVFIFQYNVTSLYPAPQRTRRQSPAPTVTYNATTTGTSIQVPLYPYSLYSYQVFAMSPDFTTPITDISTFSTLNYQTGGSRDLFCSPSSTPPPRLLPLPQLLVHP